MTRLFEARPYIIAEVGSNWRDLRDCVESIGIAKACGADAVKFQAFTGKALYGIEPPGGWNFSTELPLAWLPKLKEKADACDIDLGVTAFSPELVEAVDPYVPWHKVASSDCTWPQLLEAVARTGKPVLLSTGATHVQDITAAIHHVRDGDGVVALYCVASYPASFVDLHVMCRLLDETPAHFVGFSDHTLGYSMAVEAARRGATVIEKHFTAFPDLDTPDRPHSLTPDEMKRMVDALRGKTQPTIGPTPEERDMLLRHNRRLVATQDIPPGGILTYGETFGAYRSLVDDARGLTPFAWASVEGKKATRAIGRGEGIGPGDFE